MRICVLVTCHNRKDKTVACLRALFRSNESEHVVLHVVLVDDGSTDGTADAVASEFPAVEILAGGGNLFWNRGMHLAFAHAMEVGFDAYLWLNDDTVLDEDAISRLVLTYRQLCDAHGPNIVVVGSTRDSEGRLTYGGSVAPSRLRRFRYEKVWNAEHAVECEVMNGNCVLLPRCVADAIGNLDPAFEHAMGDIDYALRVRSGGGRIFVAPGFVATCAGNPISGSFSDKALSRGARWRRIRDRKGLPMKSWAVFTRRHGGRLWPIHFAWPYIKIFLR